MKKLFFTLFTSIALIVCPGLVFAQYCTPSYTNGTTAGDYISSLSFGLINNPSGASAAPYYTDYTYLSTVVTQGQNYALNVTSGSYSGTNYFAAYIDFNQDFVFSSTEKVGEITIGAAFTAGTISVSIPTTATVGLTTMRVMNTFGGSITSACGSYSYGEAEDYSVDITPSSGGYCTPSLTLGTISGYYIDGVEMGNIINYGTGGLGGPSYTYYSGQSTTVLTNSLSVIYITTGDASSAQYAVFADWNQDNDFTDAGELLGQQIFTSPNTIYQLTVSIPATASLGTTRLRVLCTNQTSTSPPLVACGNYLYGEAEDYQLVVQPGSGGGTYCTPVHTVNCSGNYINNIVIPSTTMNNTNTGCTSGSGTAYTAYPASGNTTANFTIGGYYTLNAQVQGDNSISLWIDFDQSGTFDADEWTQIATTTVSGTVYAVGFPIPTSALPGTTGMRVRIRATTFANGAGDACTSFGSGETEDYTVTLSGGGPCVPLHGVDCTSLYISNVSITANTLNNSTGCGNLNGLAYSVYPPSGNYTGSVTLGVPFTLNVSTSTSADISVWFDLNHNGDYETTEWLQVGSGTTFGSIGVLLPIGSLSGATGMRIRARVTGAGNGAGDACTEFFSGESEDYTLNLIDAGGQPPIADFYGQVNGAGTGIEYIDQSLNSPTSWYWIFEGATPATSTQQFPTNIQYNNAGCFDVTLIVSNAFGTDTAIAPCYVHVGDQTSCQNLFISEMVEYTSNNKSIEIYNPNSSPVVLTNYSIAIYSNGNITPNSVIPLSGTVLGNDVFVVSNTSATISGITGVTDQFSSSINFTGNDAIALLKNGIRVDIIGRIGQDSLWVVNNLPLMDYTIRRNTTVDRPETYWTDARLTYTNVGAGTTNGLGSHSSNCLNAPNNCSTNPSLCTTSTITQIGTGTSTNTNSTYPAIYANYYKSGKSQILYTAAELLAAGITAGRISALSLNVTNLNGGTSLYREFTIRMGCTSVTSLSGIFYNGLSQVFDPKDVNITTGFNTHTFDRSFVWDGVSNILVEFCFNNLVDANYTWNASTPYTTTANNMYQYLGDDVNEACLQSAASVLVFRPNVRFHHCSSAGSAPVANFQANQTQLCSGPNACVSFTDLSTNNPTSWSWSFPGSTQGTSTQQNPQNICYTAPGSYAVSLTVSNANGSNTLTLQQYITITQTPVVVATSNSSTICAGTSVQLTATGATAYQWTPTTGLSNPNIFNPIANPTTTTTYQVIGFNGNCSATSNPVTITVQQNTLNAGSDVTICAGSSTQLAGSGATSYQWTPTTGLSNPGIPNPIANPTSTTTYTLTGMVNGCTFTDQVTVTVSTPFANAGQDQTICAGGTVTLQGQGAGTVSWTPTTGLSAPNQLITLANPTITTTYTLTLNNNGCIATDEVTVFVSTVSANAGQDQTICPGSTAQLNASGGSTYQWTPSTGLSNPNIANPLASPTSTTTYTVVVTSNGCSATDQVVVTVHNTNANGGPDQTICNGSSVTLSASGGISYFWSPSTGLSNPSIANPVASPTTTTTYNVQINDGTCLVNDVVVVTVNSVQAFAVAQPNTICAGASTFLNATGGFQYSWTPSAGLSTPFSPSTTATPTQTTLYTVTVLGTNGCSDTAQVLVTVNSVQANAGQDQTVCSGGSVQLQGSGGVSFQWSPSAGLSNPTIPNPVASPLTTTTYTLTVSNGACTSSDQVTVQVLQVSANAGQDQTICFGSSTQLNASGGISYSWFPTTGLNSPTVPNPIASPAQTTTYVVTAYNGQCSAVDTVVVEVIQVNANAGQDQTICIGSSIQLNGTGGDSYYWTPGVAINNQNIANPIVNPTSTVTYTLLVTTGNCTATDQVTVNVVPGVINLSASNDTSICAGGAIQLNATGGTSYVWSPSAGLSNPNIANPIATPTQTTTYSVTVSNGVCSASEPVVITVNQVSLTTGPDQVLCPGSTVTLLATGAASYQWSPSTGLNNPTSQTPIATPTVSTMYYVTGSINGCSATDSVYVEVSTISANAGQDVTVCAGSSIQLNATGGNTYQWTPATQLSNPTIASPVSTPTSTITYTVLVSDSNCTASDQVTVTVVTGVSGFYAQGDTSICVGGTANLFAGGANTYTWFPSSGLSNPNDAFTQAGPLQTTTYTVTGSNGVCSTSLPVTVTVITPFVTAITDQTICSGDTVILVATGAASYSWSPVTGLGTPNQQTTIAFPGTTTTYIVTGTISGCSATDTVTVSVNNVNVTASADQVICDGQTVSINASGASNYVWFPTNGLSNPFGSVTDATPSFTTTYFVTGSLGSCSDVDTLIITVNPNPATPVISQAGLDLTTGVYDSYQWYFNGSPLSGETNQGLFPTQVGDYTVMVTNAAGCTAISAPYTVLTVAVDELNLTSQVLVYPNPFTGQITISFALGKNLNGRLVLREASGRMVEYKELSIPAGTTQMQFNWDTLADGVYFLEVLDEDGKKNFRLIKE